MKRIGWLCLILGLFVLAGCTCAAQKNLKGTSELQMLTEEYPPVTFMKDGKVTGFVTEIVREIMARQGIPDRIRLTSWDEAYNLALNKPNVVLFSAERTEKRENLFQWVGPVGQNSAIFYAKKGSGIRINSLDEAKKISAIATTDQLVYRTIPEGQGFHESGQLSSSRNRLKAAHERRGEDFRLHRYHDSRDCQELQDTAWTIWSRSSP